MIDWILLAAYIIGIPCWIWLEKKFCPFQEGDYTIEFDGAHEITPEIWKCNVCARAGVWPLCVAIFMLMTPILIIDKLFDMIS